MRILIADKLSSHVQQELIQQDCTVRVNPSIKGDTLTATLGDFDPQVLVVRSTKVQKEHLTAAPSLSLIIRAGAGVNTIDLDTASNQGIYVANCPGKNAVAVAELAMGHIINADRRIADNVMALRNGQWGKKTFTKNCSGLKHRTLGIIGMGSIGRELAQRATAFEMNVLGWDPFVDEKTMTSCGVSKVEELLDMVGRVNALSVHLPLNDTTRGLINAEVLQALQPGSIFINTSRGEVVNEAHLATAVQERGIRAGLDVFCQEPSSDGEWEQPLAKLDNVFGTHHIGASTAQASEAVGDEVIHIISTWLATGSVPNCVNLAQQKHASHLLVVRHEDAVGVLADILDKLRRANINVQEMENIIFRGAKAACARIQVNRPPSSDILNELRQSDRIFATDLIPLSNT
ncbi:MAG: NAD(P)-dependent oxidoreductase [Myxococcota bacterium]|nr:NAD(P)-dependent oxidoreductase [Myxococcota bacterium]